MCDDALGDSRAVEGFRDYLLVLARTRLGPGSRAKLEASDIVQMTLLEAHRKRSQFRGSGAAEMAGWLRQLLACTLADAARAAGRAKRDVSRERSLEAALDASPARLGALLAADQSTPSRQAERHEEAVRLAGVLELLPEAQRLALILRHCQGCSLDEIARRLGRTPAAAAGLLKRGLKQLRNHLDGAGRP
jgi:RNA polymerase sigma-70 factor (ECF subfamily)